MSNFKVTSITPFLPAMDYELSCRFYQELGFIETATIENATLFEMDGFGFWVQDYYVEDWANNCMLCLYVDDLNSWSARINDIDFAKNYDNKPRVFSQPHEQQGALMMQISDPAGVLWHIRQNG